MSRKRTRIAWLLAGAGLWSGAPAQAQDLAFPAADAAAVFTSDGGESIPVVEAPATIDVPDAWEASELQQSDVLPPVLRDPRPEQSDPFSESDRWLLEAIPMITPEPLAPLGYTGPSSILPRETQQSSHFVPREDRWRAGFPYWDRYGKGFPAIDDYPYKEGHWYNPYTQNVLKGDYPVWGQHTFFTATASIDSTFESRKVPVATAPGEATADPNGANFFGDPDQFFSTNYFRLQADITHGNAGFKPVDWQIRVAPVFNLNYLKAQELGVVSPDLTKGTSRTRNYAALEEVWAEMKLADLSPDYDFVSIRAGNQPFTSDFRGFIFSDTNRGVRLFGNYESNRDQFNIAFFDQVEKDTNSQLNTFDDRQQNTFIANLFRQDFIFPGYTISPSFHYNRDHASTHFDKNGALARPAPIGIAREHYVDSYYLGLSGDGHINRFNISHAYYWVFGRDENNPLAARSQRISAHMAACELSYDRDWARFRTSVFYASGDKDIYDGSANGFDTIFDNPAFAGGGFSYWQRQQVGLLGTSLVQRNSLVPNLRTSKFQGQQNFVNPGLFLVNAGVDVDLTPKTRLIQNTSFLWFDDTNVLEQYTFQPGINSEIGTDVSLGVEYRPLLSNNIIILAGTSFLIPAAGLKDIYSNPGQELGTLSSHFVNCIFTY